MLKIVQIQSPSQIEELFGSFDPQKQSWVVSDLRTKLEMQKVLIDRQGFFLESAVLRASDLWKLLLKRLAPEIRIVSKDFAKSLLRSFITENSETFGINATSEKSLFNYMTQLAPLALASDS
jgi:ATP-dependent helicase/nuclease subunit B